MQHNITSDSYHACPKIFTKAPSAVWAPFLSKCPDIRSHTLRSSPCAAAFQPSDWRTLRFVDGEAMVFNPWRSTQRHVCGWNILKPTTRLMIVILDGYCSPQFWMMRSCLAVTQLTSGYGLWVSSTLTTPKKVASNGRPSSARSHLSEYWVTIDSPMKSDRMLVRYFRRLAQRDPALPPVFRHLSWRKAAGLSKRSCKRHCNMSNVIWPFLRAATVMTQKAPKIASWRCIKTTLHITDIYVTCLCFFFVCRNIMKYPTFSFPTCRFATEHRCGQELAQTLLTTEQLPWGSKTATTTGGFLWVLSFR